MGLTPAPRAGHETICPDRNERRVSDVSVEFATNIISGLDRDFIGCFRHQLLLPRPYLVLTKPLRLDIQCQRGASVKIGWKYLDD